jgi:hypothetical protein
MTFDRAKHICKQMAQKAIPEKVSGYAVWYDDDYNTYRVTDFDRTQELIDRNFICESDIVYQHES